MVSSMSGCSTHSSYGSLLLPPPALPISTGPGIQQTAHPCLLSWTARGLGAWGAVCPVTQWGEQIPALQSSPTCYSEPQLPRQSKGLEVALPRAELSTENQSWGSSGSAFPVPLRMLNLPPN